MARLKIMLIATLATLLTIATRQSSAIAIDADWDVSPADRIDHYPVGSFSWPRFDTSAFVKRTVQSDTGHRISPGSNLAAIDDDANHEPSIRRQRRDTDNNMDKTGGAKNSREARMSSPESWSKPAIPVQFRQREDLDDIGHDNFDDRNDSDEVANLPPPIRAHYAPKTDFVTSGRSRGPEGRFLPYPTEARESREMPVSRSYDDYDVPVFRNIVREHDFDVQLPRNYYYPNRFRSQRDYYYRDRPYDPHYDRYRDDDTMDYDTYPRYRPTPKPKRIIYYATLPEIVRKPNDVRNYPPYGGPLVRPEAQIEADRIRVGPNNIEPSRRPVPYPYDNYDSYVKRSSYYDRRRPSYFAGGQEDRLKNHDGDRASFREKMRSFDRKLENQIPRYNDRLPPWPLHIVTDVNVKENERIPGRKIFGQIEGFERYDGSRTKKTSGNSERKEGVGQENSDNEKRNSSSNSSNNNSNNNNNNN